MCENLAFGSSMYNLKYYTEDTVGKSSRHRYPVEVSGTFLNLFLIYKICSPLYLLIGLQKSTLYSKSNQRATVVIRQICQGFNK